MKCLSFVIMILAYSVWIFAQTTPQVLTGEQATKKKNIILVGKLVSADSVAGVIIVSFEKKNNMIEDTINVDTSTAVVVDTASSPRKIAEYKNIPFSDLKVGGKIAVLYKLQDSKKLAFKIIKKD